MNIGLIFSRSAAIIFTAAGFFGFFWVKIPYLVQLDLWQSLVYLALAGGGWYYGWFYPSYQNTRRYNEGVTAVLLFFVLLGLTWPNWGDIVHFEEEENFFHALLFVWSVLTSLLAKKPTT